MRMALQHAAPVSAPPVARPAIQMKARIGPVDDPLEREADRIADAVVAGRPIEPIGGVSSGAAQRKCAECEAQEKMVQRKTAAGAAAEHIPQQAADAAATAVSHGGTPLTPEQRAYFEPRFGSSFEQVRIHDGPEAAAAARAINARAYTLGQDIALGSNDYRPLSQPGRRLIAHELTHVVQQRAIGDRVQRQPADPAEIEMPAEWAGDPRKRTWRRYARALAIEDAARIRKAGALSAEDRAEITAKLKFFEGEAFDIYAKEIRPALAEVTKGAADPSNSTATPPAGLPADFMAGNAFFQRMLKHPNYIDNDIKEVNYFTAEMADIHYKDGSMLRLGLVPKWMKPPVVEVDYLTPRDHFNIVDRGKDGIAFFRKFELAYVPGSTPYADLLKTYSHKVEFYAEGKSGRIVPSHVNMLTAPTLCAVLLNSERRYQENVDTAVQVGLGGTVAIGGYAGAGGWAKAPGVGLGTRTAARVVLNPVTRGLAREMEALIAQGGTKTIEAGGIRFTEVVVSKQGSNLAVKRFRIDRVNAPPGYGSIAAEAFEDAATNVARSHQMKSVTINVGIFTNPGWRVWMESLGYVFNRTEGAWIKVIKL